MPVATITPSIDVESLTNIGIKAALETRDALKVTPGIIMGFADTVGKTNKRWPDASDRWMAEIQVVEHTSANSFTTGYEQYDDTALTPGRPIAYGLAITGLAAKIGERQIRTYGTSRLGDYVKKLSGNCVGILNRGWNRRVVAGTGVGFGDFLTLNGVDSSAGVFERSVKTSQTNTVGGFNKGTWAATAPGATNALGDMANAMGSNFFQFYNTLTQIELVKPVASGKKFGLMSASFRNGLKRYLTQQERWTNGSDVDGGKIIEHFQGVKFYLDNYMPSTGTSTTTYPISAYILDAEDIFPVWAPAMRFGDTDLPDGYFGAGDFRPVSGLQNVWAMPFSCAGNVVAELFGSSGIIIRGETY